MRLPWIAKRDIPQNRGTLSPVEDVTTPLWFVRRVLAEFSEAPFYGNEVASLFIFAGLILGTILCPGHNVNGAGAALPAIVLSQFTSAAVGVLLYASKFADGGWCATYVPVVSTGPACVLALGANIPVALVAGVLGGILERTIAELVASWLPQRHPRHRGQRRIHGHHHERRLYRHERAGDELYLRLLGRAAVVVKCSQSSTPVKSLVTSATPDPNKKGTAS